MQKEREGGGSSLKALIQPEILSTLQCQVCYEYELTLIHDRKRDFISLIMNV
jgi:hypothetical protein